MIAAPLAPTTHPLPRRGLVLAAALLPLMGLLACSPSDDNDPLRVSLDEGRELLAQGQVRVFDIREPAEHATGVAAGVALLPMSQLGQRMGEIPRDAAQPVLLICNTQNRSSKVARALREEGLTHVRYVHGGMSEWVRRGWPVVRP